MPARLKSSTWLKGNLRLSGREQSPFRAAAERSLEYANYAEAEFQLQKAIAEADSYGQTAPRVVLRIDLSDVQRLSAAQEGGRPDRRQLSRALATARDAIELAAESSDAPLYVLGLDALAEVLVDLEDFAGLAQISEGAILVAEPLPDSDPAQMATRMLRVALGKSHTGNQEEATRHLVKAIEMQVTSRGEDTAETGTFLIQAAKIYRVQGEYTTAEEVVRDAIRIHKDESGPESQPVMEGLIELAQILFASGDIHGAGSQFEKAFALKQMLTARASEPAMEAVAYQLVDMQYELAALQIRCGNVNRAEELLGAGLATIQQYRGVKWLRREAQTHETLASIEESCGRLDMAVDELLRAASAWERAGDEHLQDLINVLEYCAVLQNKLLRNRDAARSRERAAQATELLRKLQEGAEAGNRAPAPQPAAERA